MTDDISIVDDPSFDASIYGTAQALLTQGHRKWDDTTLGGGKCLPHAVALETARIARGGCDIKDIPTTHEGWRSWYVDFLRDHAGTLYGHGCITRHSDNQFKTRHLQPTLRRNGVTCQCLLFMEASEDVAHDELPDFEDYLKSLELPTTWMNSAFLHAVAWKYQACQVDAKLYNLVVPANLDKELAPDPNYALCYWERILPCVTVEPEKIRLARDSMRPSERAYPDDVQAANRVCVGQSDPGRHWQAIKQLERGAARGRAPQQQTAGSDRHHPAPRHTQRPQEAAQQRVQLQSQPQDLLSLREEKERETLETAGGAGGAYSCAGGGATYGLGLNQLQVQQQQLREMQMLQMQHHQLAAQQVPQHPQWQWQYQQLQTQLEAQYRFQQYSSTHVMSQHEQLRQCLSMPQQYSFHQPPATLEASHQPLIQGREQQALFQQQQWQQPIGLNQQPILVPLTTQETPPPLARGSTDHGSDVPASSATMTARQKVLWQQHVQRDQQMSMPTALSRTSESEVEQHNRALQDVRACSQAFRRQNGTGIVADPTLPLLPRKAWVVSCCDCSMIFSFWHVNQHSDFFMDLVWLHVCCNDRSGA